MSREARKKRNKKNIYFAFVAFFARAGDLGIMSLNIITQSTQRAQRKKYILCVRGVLCERRRRGNYEINYYHAKIAKIAMKRSIPLRLWGILQDNLLWLQLFKKRNLS